MANGAMMIGLGAGMLMKESGSRNPKEAGQRNKSEESAEMFHGVRITK